MRPYVFLDVDGVLNAWLFQPDRAPEDAYTDFEVHHDVGGFSLVLSAEMGRELVAATAPAEVLWLTTWLDRAPDLVAPLLSLPKWPALEYGWLKAEAVAAVLADDPRPFVWLDDVEADHEQLEAVAPVVDPLPEHLLIRPTPETGLRPSEISRIADWIRRAART